MQKKITYNLNNYEHERTKGKSERTTIIHELQYEAHTLLKQGKGSSIQKEFGIAEERIRGKAIRLIRRILIGDVAQENLSSAKRWLSYVNAYFNGENKEGPKAVERALNEDAETQFYSNLSARESRLADYDVSPCCNSTIDDKNLKENYDVEIPTIDVEKETQPLS